MNKLIKRALLFVSAMLMLTATATAQQMPPIPVDPAVKIGKLPNGLTYYIRHNEKPKGQADFYIAQKVGSILEEENQRGLAHFLEHMCFNGTENFPGTMLRDWLETVGVKFGANLNAYTSIDETVYNISNVPVARTGVQDSCLLILHDWANALTLDPKEIDNERGVIHEEWRRSLQGTMRIIENLLPVIYPDNKYGERLPIGTIEVIDNFPPQAIRDYYETWYRPDQQGIIVVGDIDVDYIEGKIKELFSDIEMPANPKERVYLPVADNEGTIYAIGSDPEQTSGVVSLMFKMDAATAEEKADLTYLVSKYMLRMMTMMLNQRLADMAQSADAPFESASTSFGEFFVSKTKDALDVEAVAKGNDLMPAIEAVYRELLRAQRGGFTVSEYERARSEYLSQLEKQYNSRDTRESGAYVSQYVKNFTDDEPIPSIEDLYQIMNQIVPMLPVDAVNTILPQVVTNDNRVVMVLAPDNGVFKVPTEAEIAALIAKIDAEDIEPYRDQMKEEPLIPELPAPGKVVSITDDPTWDAKVITLSNGIKVTVKPTELKKDEILFSAEALGGTSTIGDDQAANLALLSSAIENGGLGTYTNMDIRKYLQGKQVGVNMDINTYTRSMSGFSTVKDLPTMMELLYMSFVDPTISEEDFATTQAQLLNQLENAESNPQFVFLKGVYETLFKSPANHQPSKETVMAADRNAIVDIAHKATANAADYSFVFVGDINLDTFVPLLEQYVATLPTTTAEPSKVVINLDREIVTGKNDKTATMKMQTPQTWAFIMIDGDIPYTAKNNKVASVASQVLSKRLINKIREEMGAVYSISAIGGMDALSKYNAMMQIPFPMKPELKAEVLAEINSMLQDMTTNIADDEIAGIKEYMVKNAVEGLDNNSKWLSAILTNNVLGVDTLHGEVDLINSITVDDVKNYMKELLQQGNFTTYILDPAE